MRLAAILLTLGFLGPGSVLAAEPEKPVLRIGVGSAILNYMPLALGQNLGYFKQEGLDVTIENFQAGGSKALQALVGGSVDGVVGFYDHTIVMQAAGKAVSCAFLLNDVPGIVMGVRADLADRVKGPADLKGLRVGITSPGSSTDVVAHYYASRGGLGPRDVSYIAVASGAPGLTALEAKNIDALMYFDPSATLIARKGIVKTLFDARTVEGSKTAFGGIYPTACLYFNQSFIDKNPETVQRLAGGFLRTMRFIAEKPPEAVLDAIPAAYKLDDRPLMIEVLKSSRDMFSKTGIMDGEAVKTVLTVISAYDPKVSGAQIDLSKTYTNRFAEEAAKRLKN